MRSLGTGPNGIGLRCKHLSDSDLHARKCRRLARRIVTFFATDDRPPTLSPPGFPAAKPPENREEGVLRGRSLVARNVNLRRASRRHQIPTRKRLAPCSRAIRHRAGGGRGMKRFSLHVDDKRLGRGAHALGRGGKHFLSLPQISAFSSSFRTCRSIVAVTVTCTWPWASGVPESKPVPRRSSATPAPGRWRTWASRCRSSR